MNKILNTRSIISAAIVICLLVGLFFVLRPGKQEFLIKASISSVDIQLGDMLTYSDSTSSSKSWLWEFGNGDYSVEPTGIYQFPEVGRYQIRLKVNNKLEKTFLVRVRPRPEESQNEHLIQIDAPTEAIQGEYIMFSANGNDQDWHWEFGESGIIDSREKNPIYAYESSGVFFVYLHTEKTQYPIVHQIMIHPKYTENDSTDIMTVAGNDIKTRLQNIVDGKPFNPNYNYVLSTYLCNNPNILVTVNNTKRNDFYSYCQGLRFTGRGTKIEMVFVELSNLESNCIDHIIILQRMLGQELGDLSKQ